MAKMLCGAENSMLESRPYTDSQFRATIRKQKKSGFLCSLTKLAKDKETRCPPVTDTEAWIKYLNLTYRTPAACKRITIKRNKIRDYETALFDKSRQCTATHCATELQKEQKLQKQMNKIRRAKCGAPALTRRYFKCVGSIDRSAYGPARQEVVDCRESHCQKEQMALRKYLRR